MSRKEQGEQLARIKNIRDEDIDFSDAPEITRASIASGQHRIVRWGGVRVGSGRPRANNVPMVIRIPPAIARRVRTLAKREGTTISAIAARALASV